MREAEWGVGDGERCVLERAVKRLTAVWCCLTTGVYSLWACKREQDIKERVTLDL